MREQRNPELIPGWFLLLCLFLIWYGIALGQTIQLSRGQPFSSVYLPSLPQATSERVVWVQDAITDGAFELWSAPIAGGAPVRLSQALAAGQSVKFQVTPDGQRVVYVTDQTTRGVPDLYSASILGGASVKLSMDLSQLPGQVRDFAISPTSQRVYFAADGTTNNKLELYRVDVGGGPTTKLNASILAGHDVFEFAVSPQDRIVYRVGISPEQTLWTVPGNGRAADARRISRTMVSGGGAMEFALSADGQHTVYRADALDNGRFDLWSVPTAGGASTRLDLADGRSVRADFTADAMWVTYSYGPTEFYRVPVMGGESVAMFLPPTTPPVTSLDGLWRVIPIGVGELASMRAGLLRRVSCPGQVVTTTFLARPAYSITPDSRRVVYVASGEIWSSPISGSVCEIFNDGFESGWVTRWQ